VSQWAPRVRVLYLQPSANFGGAERQAATSIPFLGEWGIDVVPLVGPGQTVVDWLEERGVTGFIHSCNFPADWPAASRWARVRHAARYVGCLRRLGAQVEEIARRHAVDLIFAAMPFSWVAATRVARKLDLPVVWRAGGTEVVAGGALGLGAWAPFRRPDLLICCGDAVRRRFEPLVGAPTEVVRNGVDLTQFHPRAAERTLLRPAAAELVVGLAARLAAQKRPQDFLAMAARVRASHPKVAFLLAGEGSRLPYYQDMARALGAGEAVRFLGFVADMRAFYAACDVIVLPSRSEGRPNVVLEAMAMRRALAVSDAPGTREIVTHGREALVFPVGDVDAFTSAVRTLIERPALRAELAANALSRVVREFGARASAGRLARLLRAVAFAALPIARRPALMQVPGLPT